jgi:hypothetical protein
MKQESQGQDADGSHTALLTLASTPAALIRVLPFLSKLNSKSQDVPMTQSHQKYDYVSYPDIY